MSRRWTGAYVRGGGAAVVVLVAGGGCRCTGTRCCLRPCAAVCFWVLGELAPHGTPASSLRVLHRQPNGDRLATGYKNGALRVWAMPEGA